jgi:hypothetical protein
MSGGAPFDLPGALLGGAFATALLTLVLSASQGLGWSRISLPYLLGTVVSPRRGRAMLIGSAAHFVLGIGFALLYVLFFEQLGRSGAALGAGLGLLQGLFVLTAGLELLAAVHPRMASRHHGPTPTRQLEPPGFLARNYGRRTPLITLLAHIVYGAALGLFYPVG